MLTNPDISVRMSSEEAEAIVNGLEALLGYEDGPIKFYELLNVNGLFALHDTLKTELCKCEQKDTLPP